MNISNVKLNNLIVLILLLLFLSGNCFSVEDISNLPVKDPVSVGAEQLKEFRVTNLFSIEQLVDSVKD